MDLRRPLSLALALSASFFIAACAGTTSPANTPSTVRPADFAADQPPQPAPLAAAIQPPPPRVAPTPPPPQPAPPTRETIAAATPPISAAPRPVDATPLLIDAKVGDINGRAIFVTDFLAPMKDRLEAKSREPSMTLTAWRSFASAEIARELNAQIADEVLRAEALAAFTPEMKQGLFSFMQQLQRDLERRQGGSRALANRSLEETEGISIDEWRKRREDIELIRFQIADKIDQRVSIAARDITQRYEQSQDKFSPPPLAVFRLVQVAKDDPANAQRFAQLLADAPSFEAAARSDLNLNKRDKAGLEERELKGDRDKAALFANPALNDAARTLAPGQTAGPLELSASVAWLHLERIADRSVSLYDAQLAIEEQLLDERRSRDRRRYLAQLVGKASVSDLEQTVLRILDVAQARHYKGRPER